MTDSIPQTQILSEATIDSLQEVLSLDPEKYTTENRLRVIEAMREWCLRIAQADNAGKRPRAPKIPQQQIAAPTAKAGDLL